VWLDSVKAMVRVVGGWPTGFYGP
jgi:hypothetical protein